MPRSAVPRPSTPDVPSSSAPRRPEPDGRSLAVLLGTVRAEPRPVQRRDGSSAWSFDLVAVDAAGRRHTVPVTAELADGAVPPVGATVVVVGTVGRRFLGGGAAPSWRTDVSARAVVVRPRPGLVSECLDEIDQVLSRLVRSGQVRSNRRR